MLVASGDESESSLQRFGKAEWELATESLQPNLRGRQLVDELARTVSGEASARYLAQCVVVTNEGLVTTVDNNQSN
jgi:hypothetical protein